MIEKILYDYLNMALSVPAYMERPDAPPASFVLIEKTGGSRQEHIQGAVIALQSMAQTLYKSAALNEEVKTVMDDLIDLPDVSAVHLNSDYNYTNKARKEYRYQAVYEIVYY